ncbi:hypothetical protein A0O36_00360 [Piscirickettsiaceae bacterium NZ-RLO1]|nr:hypothetical protein A0O36_00360 [Piscirickettsiaceae bacterium NZ-RLO1]
MGVIRLLTVNILLLFLVLMTGTTVVKAQTIQIATEHAGSPNHSARITQQPIQQKLNQIISQQLIMLNYQNQSDLHGPVNSLAAQTYLNNPYNNSIGFGVLSGSVQELSGQLAGQSPMYQSIIGNEGNKNNSSDDQDDNINENIRFLLNLVEGKYDSDKKPDDFIEAGASGKSSLLVNAVLSKINANNKVNSQLLSVIQGQMNNGWMNNLKFSSRDQLLRDISVQLSIGNYINYQKLQAEYLNALLNTAKLIDNNQFYSLSAEDSKNIESAARKLSDIDRGISKLVGRQKRPVIRKGN